MIGSFDSIIIVLAAFLSQIVPKNYKQALEDPSWVDAMKMELQQFRKLKVWELLIFLQISAPLVLSVYSGTSQMIVV